MARTVQRLTPKRVSNAKPRAGDDSVLLADGGNLYLQCTRGKEGHIRRSWLFRYELDGRRREMGLGALHTVGLAEAREKARGLRKQVLDRIDPLEAREQAERARLAERARTVTFRQCAKSYIALHEDSWKNDKHRAQWDSTLETYAYPVIGGMSVRDVDSASIMKIIEPLWGTKTETASRVRGRIEAILDYATASGFRTGDNPARHVGVALPKRSKVRKVKHHAALPYQELPDFMAELRHRGSLSARALEFTILTAARTGEVIGATWPELDLQAGTWTVQGTRMKAGKPHTVPLPDRVLEILRALPRGARAERVFPLSNMAMLELLRGMRPARTTHGFRSTFKDWANDRTNFANYIVEAALAHVVGDKTEAAYRRSDALEKRRRLMQAWSDYCAKPVPAYATVTPMRKAGADV
jgi:integrase